MRIFILVSNQSLHKLNGKYIPITYQLLMCRVALWTVMNTNNWGDVGGALDSSVSELSHKSLEIRKSFIAGREGPKAILRSTIISLSSLDY